MREEVRTGANQKKPRLGLILSSRFALWSLVAVTGVSLASLAVHNGFLTFSLVLANIYMGLALAWDFSSGLTGYINFGPQFFFGLGAFATGYLYYAKGVPVAATLPVDLAVGAAAGFLFSLPTLQFRGPFFTLLSLVLPLIAELFVVNFWTVLRMPTIGYYGIPQLGSSYDVLLLSTLVIDAASLLIFYRIYISHFGLVMRGIRDDEDAVSAQGINTFRYKVVAFTLASGLMGLMGGAYASLTSFAGVDAFGLNFLLYPMLIAVLGGFGSIAGSVAMSYVATLLSQYLNLFVGSLTLIVFSALALVMVLFLRGGLFGYILGALGGKGSRPTRATPVLEEGGDEGQ